MHAYTAADARRDDDLTHASSALAAVRKLFPMAQSANHRFDPTFRLERWGVTAQRCDRRVVSNHPASLFAPAYWPSRRTRSRQRQQPTDSAALECVLRGDRRRVRLSMSCLSVVGPCMRSGMDRTASLSSDERVGGSARHGRRLIQCGALIASTAAAEGALALGGDVCRADHLDAICGYQHVHRPRLSQDDGGALQWWCRAAVRRATELVSVRPHRCGSSRFAPVLLASANAVAWLR